MTTTPFLTGFERFAKEASGAALSWLAPVRHDAMKRFAELGFPTTKHEAWKYTSVAPIAKGTFNHTARDEARQRAASLDKGLLHGLAFGCWTRCRLVFVDGHLSPALSDLSGLGNRCYLSSLAEAGDEEKDLLKRHLTRHADHRDHAFAALNTAFLGDGALVRILEGKVLQEPVHIIYVSTGETESAVSHPRTLVLAEEASQATVVESYIGLGSTTFTNAVTEVVLSQNAVVDHVKLQRESKDSYHVATMHVSLGRDSNFASHSISMGGKLVRNDVNAVLESEGADCTLNGLYVLDGNQHVDNHTVVDHARPHGTSHQLYKGVLDGQSRGVFDGVVIVRPDAQKTDSRQENRNLILSEEALVNTKPTLLISADDVKCSHAATTGQVDDNSMFYLRSRAIDPDTARRIMIRAFCRDIIRRVKVKSVRAGLEALLFGEDDTDWDVKAGGEE